MNILGLKVLGHDTGAALIDDAKIVAISQERIDRKKYSRNFPIESINYCLSEFGFKHISEVDAIAIEIMDETPESIITACKQQGIWEDIKSKTTFVNHHDAHAASAFFCSPHKDAAVLVVDNGGQTTRPTKHTRRVETESFYRGTNNHLELIARNYAPVSPYDSHLLGISGVGNFYSQMTYYVNFGKHEEGKTMGLAPYGNDTLVRTIPPELIMRTLDGSNSKVVFPTPLEPHPIRDPLYLIKRGTYSRLHGWIDWIQTFYRRLTDPQMRDYFNYFPKPPKEFREFSRRPKSSPLPDTYYTNMAYLAQHYLEQVMIGYAHYLYNTTQCDTLCIAGGVGLNSVANKKILDQTSFKHIFIQPAAGDSGLALGAALWVKHQIKGEQGRLVMNNDYLGCTYSEKTILDALKGTAYTTLEHPEETAAELMEKGLIIGWYQGRSEHGPRALGNRSILCSPIPIDMKDKLNAQVKHRESFRPFAPVVLEEHMKDYFDLSEPSPFMLLVAKVKKDTIPAVTHVDGTGRVQTINEGQNPLFYRLIKAFERRTGVPVVLNTSFNDNGEPIVETPADAVKSFTSTNLDALIIGNYLVKRSDEST